ncbi:helix-turn-helix transcriptional regulator [Butyrivibrio sp. WCE2006]|uniref:helix-turn-helix transcriptional regulator n=1 Tax=Butyrivibrio sp. WCE2006 TaxID=1410611 RepID=UPI0005D2098A|nr:AraC family transcriptional regulator [Butyrivibrio sp. WCE2006]
MTKKTAKSHIDQKQSSNPSKAPDFNDPKELQKNLAFLEKSIRDDYKEIISSVDDHIFMTQDTPGADTGTRRIQEKALYYYVSSGDITKIDEIVAISVENSDKLPTLDNNIYGDVSEDPLLYSKYMLIASVTLATRAAIDGGLAEHIAYAISDGFLRHMDKQTNIQKINMLSNKALRTLTYAVHDYNYRNCSLITKNCCDFILRHLHDDIRMKTLAELTHRSPNYISDLFQKELGVRPTIFIRDKKLEYARVMLETTDLPVSSVSDLLAFPSTSSFITYFNKKYGTTPLQYRSKRSSSM